MAHLDDRVLLSTAPGRSSSAQLAAGCCSPRPPVGLLPTSPEPGDGAFGRQVALVGRSARSGFAQAAGSASSSSSARSSASARARIRSVRLGPCGPPSARWRAAECRRWHAGGRLRRRATAASARRAGAGTRPSRWGGCCSFPPSQTRVRLPTASSRARSWETRTTAPSKAVSASSSASRLSMSRWLVGSSRIRTLAPEATRIASESRRCSPPEMSPSDFSASEPEKRKPPSSGPRLLRLSVRLPALRRLEHVPFRRRRYRRAGRGSRP